MCSKSVNLSQYAFHGTVSPYLSDTNFGGFTASPSSLRSWGSQRHPRSIIRSGIEPVIRSTNYREIISSGGNRGLGRKGPVQGEDCTIVGYLYYQDGWMGYPWGVSDRRRISVRQLSYGLKCHLY